MGVGVRLLETDVKLRNWKNTESALGMGKFKNYMEVRRSSPQFWKLLFFFHLDVYLGRTPVSLSGDRDLCESFSSVVFISSLSFIACPILLTGTLESGCSLVWPFPIGGH